ncbi:MAG: hypothetical protein AAF702_28785 [Chloroflexota bacterium]
MNESRFEHWVTLFVLSQGDDQSIPYTITVATPTGFALTGANTDAVDGFSYSNNDNISDVRDSDAKLVGGMPTILYTTGSAGQNNHGLDFGFALPASGQVGILNMAPAQVLTPTIAVDK